MVFLKGKSRTSTILNMAVLVALSIFSLLGVGIASWITIGDSSTFGGPAVEVASFTDLRGYFSLDTNQGDNKSGVSGLQYCSTGLVNEDEIGNKGNLTYYFYLDAASFRQKFSWTSATFSLTLKYRSYQTAYTLINSNTTAELKYLANGTMAYASSAVTTGTLATSLYDKDLVSTITLPIDSTSSYLHFELNYVFTAADVSVVLNNECKASGVLFNLALSLKEATGS
jgi:hypothetical protein